MAIYNACNRKHCGGSIIWRANILLCSLCARLAGVTYRIATAADTPNLRIGKGQGRQAHHKAKTYDSEISLQEALGGVPASKPTTSTFLGKSKPPRANLTEAQRQAICADTRPSKAIAADYGLTAKQVVNVRQHAVRSGKPIAKRRGNTGVKRNAGKTGYDRLGRKNWRLG